MEIVKTIAYFVYVAIFLIAMFISLKFQFGSEGRDERGQQINNYVYMAAFPLFPIGYLFATLYDDFVRPLDYETYKWIIWVLVSGAYIIHATMITALKRKQ